MSTRVATNREVLEMILESASERRLHPKETNLLLRGKASKNSIYISEVFIPPLAIYGNGFSSFQVHMLPIDFSIIGLAQSHPSGNLKLSAEEQNHFIGKIMLIVAFHYQGKESTAVYNRIKEKLVLEVT
jgi:proteasome lid subunit RPN8/RPN11